MSSGLKAGRYPVESRLPYERSRIEEVRSLIESGIDPLAVTIVTNGGGTRMTMKDIANYLEYYAVPFTGVVSSFTLEGDKNDRQALL